MILKTEKEQLHKCKVCDKTFATERSLHAHLKAHKLRLAEYYQTYYPRYDKHDGSIIKFKNKDLSFAVNAIPASNINQAIPVTKPQIKSEMYPFGLIE